MGVVGQEFVYCPIYLSISISVSLSIYLHKPFSLSVSCLTPARRGAFEVSEGTAEPLHQQRTVPQARALHQPLQGKTNG